MKKSTIIGILGVVFTVLGYFVLFPVNSVVGSIATFVGCAFAISGLILSFKGR